MRRGPVTVLSAATAVAALGVCGCSRDLAQPSTGPLATSATASTQGSEGGSLPPAGALGDVMVRLTDPSVPGGAKVDLVENTAPGDAAALDRFATAMRDTGFTPVTVSASEIRWSDSHPGDVLAIIKVTGPDSGPNGANPGEFSFPMEFHRTAGGWQLTRETATMLLAFGNAHTQAPPPPPGPKPPP